MFLLIKNKHILPKFEEIGLVAAKYKKTTKLSTRKVRYDKTNPFAAKRQGSVDHLHRCLHHTSTPLSMTDLGAPPLAA